MQKLMLVLVLVVASATVQAQSLKDALFGGKLRMDSNSVLRKTDDVKARIDTAQKKPADSLKAVVAVAPADSVVKAAAPVTATAPATMATSAEVVAVDTVATAVAPAPVAAVPTKSNTKLWKEYADELTNKLKPEIQSSKKIKKESYYITVAYEVDVDSKVSITNVTTAPENAVLQGIVKERLEETPPQLNPILDSNGAPRKAKRTYSFSVTKD